MLEAYYNLQTGAAVILTFLFISLSAHVIKFALRKWIRRDADSHEFDTSINLMQVVAAYIGIIIAFSGVQAWQNYSDAQTAIYREATTARELYRDLASYGPETEEIRRSFRAYVTSILVDEYPLLKSGRASRQTDYALNGVFRQFSMLEPSTSREEIIYGEAFSKLNDSVEYRMDRILSSRSNLPDIILFISLFGAILTLVYTGSVKNTIYNRIYIIGLDIIISLLFVFILTFNNPYKREGEVDFGEIAALDEAFNNFDATHAR